MKSIIVEATILMILLVAACQKDDAITPTPTTESGDSCKFKNMDVSSEETYMFDTPFEEQFSQSSRWLSNAEITLVNEKGQLTATNNEPILEAWKLFRVQMPYDKSWEISVDVSIPLFWNSSGGNEAQVGAGIFVGKPVVSGQASKVYECNMAAINGDMRFVQAQLVANRLGDDPIDVQYSVLAQSKESANLKIQFCATNKTLSLYIDDTIVGEEKAIDASGLDNWKLSDNDVMDVGIMGFAENTIITSNQPIFSKFDYKIYV